MNKPLYIGTLAVLLSSCAGYHVRKGDEAYALMAYEKAGKHYERAMSLPVERPVLLRAADAARRQNELDRAKSLYGQAHAQAPLSGDEAYRYGQVLMGQGEWQKARDHFLQVLQDNPEDRAALDLFASCQGYRTFSLDSGRFTVAELPIEGVKTAFAAVPYKGGLVFAGERDVTKARSNPWNGRSFLDIYQVERKGSVFWKPAVPLKGKVNGPYHEGPVVFSTDGRTLYFTRSNYYGRKLLKDEADVSHLKLFRATLDDEGEWSDIREFAYNSEEWSVGHPALSNDGRILYFVSDMPGGQGGTDIWRCTDNGQGWEKPENLGLTINTPGNEMFPTVNGDALYFSSTAHENMGGLDIFETRQQGSQWVEPRNMLYPINTAHDDFSFVLDSTGNGGFLSSDRTGLDRIHAFTMNQPDFILEGEVVDDPSGRFLPHTEVQLVPLDGGDTLRGLTDEEGKFHFALKPGTQYTLRAERDAMITASTTISTVGLTSSGTLHERLGLRGFELDKPIALDNIYYDYDKWDIRPDAAAELDKLAKLITDNPQLNFELSSHTDSRGGDMYNLVLSDARANSAVDYLLRVGVDPERLRPQGYGESKLINGCGNGERCTEEEHQANRRTEFKVVSVKEMAVTP